MSLVFALTIIFVTSVVVFIFKLILELIKDLRTDQQVVYYSELERCYFDPSDGERHLLPTAMLSDVNHQGLLKQREKLFRSLEASLNSDRMSPSDRKEREELIRISKSEFEENNRTRQQVGYLEKNKERVDLSIIVPAYNEQERLPRMMDEAVRFLEARCNYDHEDPSLDLYNGKFTYEIIIVDDGSTDGTANTALEYSRKYGTNKIRVLKLARNRGKGGAVRLGALATRGRYILFADADGASEFADVEKLEQYILNAENKSTNKKNNRDTKLLLAIGSRAHLEKEAIASRSLFRTMLMKGFHFLVWSTCVRSVRDTQCGFKLFNRPAARVLFNHYHNESWAFDVELLFLAEQIGCDIGEVAINWTEVDGSKIVPVFSWLRMGFDVLCIALNYFVGIYKVPSSHQVRLEADSSETSARITRSATRKKST